MYFRLRLTSLQNKYELCVGEIKLSKRTFLRSTSLNYPQKVQKKNIPALCK